MQFPGKLCVKVCFAPEVQSSKNLLQCFWSIPRHDPVTRKLFKGSLPLCTSSPLTCNWVCLLPQYCANIRSHFLALNCLGKYINWLWSGSCEHESTVMRIWKTTFENEVIFTDTEDGTSTHLITQLSIAA